MAENNNRENRRTRGRDRGGDQEPGRQHEGQKRAELFIAAPRAKAPVTVKMNDQVPRNAVAVIWAGEDKSTGNPFIKRITNLGGANVGGVPIDPNDGIGKIDDPRGGKIIPVLNLTGLPPECTHLTVTITPGNITTNQVVIPSASDDYAPEPEKKDKAPDIEVINPPRDPDPATGLFLVTVATRQDSKPADRNFVVFSSVGLTANATTRIGEGLYQITAGFAPRMAQINFRLDDGQQASVWLRK